MDENIACCTDQIIEIACIVTDGDLNVVAEGPDLVIKASKKLLDGMDDWCKEHHGGSGLTKASLNATHTTSTAEAAVLSFIQQHVPGGRVAPLGGNSVHVDKMFLQKEMPKLVDFLHYRIIDVSTIKECVRRWLPRVAGDVPPKTGAHRALEDIRESIAELKYYREKAFVKA
ncbi:ribonuclease H-like domain-containing protein [Powellomyces hirtus]|nr:ribonuclease H-like domain-containing protein [Powellomyces hirtus]